MMSQSNDSLPDPVRPATLVTGNSPGCLNGQCIDNAAAKYSQFVDPVNPANFDSKRTIVGADATRANTNAVQRQAILTVVVVSFVAANFVLLRSLFQSPDAWLQGNIPAIALQYGFSLLSSTLVFTVIGSVVVIAGYEIITTVKQLRKS